MEIAAMDVDVGAAKALLADGIEGQLVKGLTRVPGAADERVRANAHFQERLLHVQTPQHLHDVGAKDDAGADAGKRWRLLVDGYGKAFTLQERRARQSPKPGTHDSDPSPALQAFTSQPTPGLTIR